MQYKEENLIDKEKTDFFDTDKDINIEKESKTYLNFRRKSVLPQNEEILKELSQHKSMEITDSNDDQEDEMEI